MSHFAGSVKSSLLLHRNVLFSSMTSRKHLRTKVTTDFHLTYSKKWGKSGVGIEIIKMDYFQYFSIKSYVVDAY